MSLSDHPHDPQPPEYNPRNQGRWIIPMSRWRVHIVYNKGQEITLEVEAPFWIFAYGIAVQTAKSMYPEGGGIKKLKVRFQERVPPV